MNTTQFGQQLAKALEDKKNDINTFVWKGKRTVVNGVKTQEEIRLMDATEEQLKKFYTHCQSMLFNKDKHDPGRVVLLEMIKDQRNRCNTELFLRYIENAFMPSDRPKKTRLKFLQELEEAISNTPNFPRKQIDKIPISCFKSDFTIPEEFEDLPIQYVRSGCLGKLGLFNKKHITMSFLLNLGIWFDKVEKKEFLDESALTGRKPEEIIKERCRLRDNVKVKIFPQAALTYKEFRAMLLLRNIEYISMTTDQLRALREKVLYYLEDEVHFHVDQWEERMAQIQAVAKARNINLE